MENKKRPSGKGDKRLTGERRPRVIREDQKKKPERTHRNDDGERPRRYERPERKPYDKDRPVREKRSYDRSERKSDDREHRPKEERPYRSGHKPYDKDRPVREKRSYDRPERKSDDREHRPREERPYRSEHKPYSKDRPAREKRSYDRPERKSDDREHRPREERPYRSERKPYGKDRPEREKRSYDRPERKSDDREHRPREERPYRSERKSIEKDRPVRRNHDERGSYPKPRKEFHGKPDRKNKGDDDGAIRLNKYIANSGICSRREADKLIEAGAVSVNGEVVTELGSKVYPSDKVQYGGQTLSREKLRYVLLNKPKGFITTTDDPEDRKTVMNLVAKACKERIYPVGRLDRNTTGLLLFTNDGEMAKKLAHPRYGIKKIYHVVLDRNLTKADLTKIADGLTLDDGPVKVDAIEYISDAKDKKEIGIELHSGKNRVVRRIFESLDYKVVRLDRVAFAGLTKKNLPRGEWRFLEEKEINMLKIIS